MLEFLFIKKKLQHWCFPMNIGKFLRKPILKNIGKQVLLWVAINIHVRKHHFIFLLLFVRFARLLGMNKNCVITPCHKQLCFQDRILNLLTQICLWFLVIFIVPTLTTIHLNFYEMFLWRNTREDHLQSCISLI